MIFICINKETFDNLPKNWLEDKITVNRSEVYEYIFKDIKNKCNFIPGRDVVLYTNFIAPGFNVLYDCKDNVEAFISLLNYTTHTDKDQYFVSHESISIPICGIYAPIGHMFISNMDIYYSDELTKGKLHRATAKEIYNYYMNPDEYYKTMKEKYDRPIDYTITSTATSDSITYKVD